MSLAKDTARWKGVQLLAEHHRRLSPYVIRGDIGAYEVVDTRTDRVAHTFKHHPDAESCKDAMNEWVRREVRQRCRQAARLSTGASCHWDRISWESSANFPSTSGAFTNRRPGSISAAPESPRGPQERIMHYLIVGCIVVGVGIPVCEALGALLADIWSGFEWPWMAIIRGYREGRK